MVIGNSCLSITSDIHLGRLCKTRTKPVGCVTIHIHLLIIKTVMLHPLKPDPLKICSRIGAANNTFKQTTSIEAVRIEFEFEVVLISQLWE